MYLKESLEFISQSPENIKKMLVFVIEISCKEVQTTDYAYWSVIFNCGVFLNGRLS